MKFIIALLLIFCSVLWINNNSNYIIYSDVEVKDIQTYVSEKGGLLISKIGKDIGDIDWRLEK